MREKEHPSVSSDDIQRYEARLAENSGSPVFAQLAEAYRRTGRAAEAVALCRRGLERFPRYGAARFTLVKACVDLGDLDAAVGELERLLSLEPDHKPALRLAVDVCLRRRTVTLALEYLRRLLQLDHADRAAQSRLRALEVALGGSAEKMEWLCSLLGDDLFATVTFGDILLRQGLYDEATAVFTRILLREPTHALAGEGLESALAQQAQGRRPKG